MQNYPITNYHHEIEMASINKFVYFKQNFIPDQPSTVLVNPHFNKKVFINPNYVPISSRKIHINPNMALNNNKIHVNPKILQTKILQKIEPKQNVVTYSSKTKLIRTPVKQKTIQESKRIRRTSVHSTFKIVKSSNEFKRKLLFNTKYKLRRETANKSVIPRNPIKLRSKFKLDNTRNTKYVFVNRFLSISDIAKKVPLRTKSLNLLNISGNIYKNSPNQLLKLRKKEKRRSVVSVNKTKYKLVRKKSLNGDKINKKVKMPREKLKKCNIPCPYYRKFGKCKGKEQGKCPRKHDSDQIALCTKFLQGACIDSKCLLSHNVSAEKMPTCKFYLEGSCSKDNCPYLHVRINPKADVCRDFLEGFCKKASQCDKRHQFLCPDFEKKGDCLKSRCPYPHGRMVRKYSDYNKHKFAKKSSTNNAKLVNNDKIEEIEAAIRYYSDKNVVDEVDANRKIDFRLRPKLGELPSFISLEDI